MLKYKTFIDCFKIGCTATITGMSLLFFTTGFAHNMPIGPLSLICTTISIISVLNGVTVEVKLPFFPIVLITKKENEKLLTIAQKNHDLLKALMNLLTGNKSLTLKDAVISYTQDKE